MTDLAAPLPKGLLARIRASATPLFLVFLPGCFGAFLAFALGQGAPIDPPDMLDSEMTRFILQVLVGGVASFAFVYVLCGVSQDSTSRLIGIALIAGYGWNVVLEKFDDFLQVQEENEVLTEKADVLESNARENLLSLANTLSVNPTPAVTQQFLKDYAEIRPYLTLPDDATQPNVLDDQLNRLLEGINSGASIGGGAVTLSPETTLKLQSLKPWVPDQTWEEIQQLPGVELSQ